MGALVDMVDEILAIGRETPARVDELVPLTPDERAEISAQLRAVEERSRSQEQLFCATGRSMT